MWKEIGDLASALTLCAIGIGLARRTYNLFDAVIGFFKAQSAAMVRMEKKLDELIDWLKKFSEENHGSIRDRLN